MIPREGGECGRLERARVLTKISSLLQHTYPTCSVSSGARDLDTTGACCISHSCMLLLLSCMESAIRTEPKSNIVFAFKSNPIDDNAEVVLLWPDSFMANVPFGHVPDAGTGWLLSKSLKSKGCGGVGTPPPPRSTACSGWSAGPADVSAAAEAAAEEEEDGGRL